jgi:hypothetical protein
MIGAAICIFAIGLCLWKYQDIHERTPKKGRDIGDSIFVNSVNI